MIIKPYSAIAQDAFVPADYPAVKHFFPCDEAVGTNALSDVVGDVVMTFAGLTRTADDHAVSTSATGAQAVSGTWSAPGTKPFVFFLVDFRSTANASVILGNTGGAFVNFTNNAPSVDTAATSDAAAAFTLTTAGTVYGKALVVNAVSSATGLNSYQFNTSNTATKLANAATTFATYPSITDGGATHARAGTTSSGLYGLAYLEFTTLPADLLVGLAWMTAEWAQGNKAIYPAWKGLS